MGVYTRAGFLLGTNASVAPAKADLRISILVLTRSLAFSFRCVVKSLGNVGKVIFECFFSVLGLLLAPHEVVYEFPQPLVRAE